MDRLIRIDPGDCVAHRCREARRFSLSPEHQVHPVPRTLALWKVILDLRLSGDTVALHVTDHAHDAAPLWTLPAALKSGRDSLADRILIGPVLVRKRLVNYADLHRIARVRVSEISPAQKRNPQHLKVIGADHMRIAMWGRLVRRSLQTLDKESRVPMIVAHRQSGDNCGSFDAAQRTHLFEHLAEERRDSRVVTVFELRQRQLHRQHPRRIKAGIHLSKPYEALNQQA